MKRMLNRPHVEKREIQCKRAKGKKVHV